LITLISNNHKRHLPKEVSNDSQQKQSLISTWHTLNRSICIKDIHEVCLDQFMRHNWRGSGQAPPWTQSLRICANWLAVTYRNSIRNWRGKRPIMSSLQNVTEQANFRTKLAKRILSYDIKL